MDNPEPEDEFIEAIEILEAEEEFFQAVESLDVDLIMQCWSMENDVSMLFPGNEMVHGHLMVRKAWQNMAQNTREIRLMFTPISVVQGEDIGWSFSSGMVMSTHGDETLSIELFLTVIYRLDELDWKVVHLHATPSPFQQPFIEQRLN